MGRRHTSEPRWPRRRPSLDLGARRVVVAGGPDAGARSSTAAWRAEAEEAGIDVVAVLPGPDGTAAASLRRALTGATAATRLVLAGDEAFLGRTYAIALEAGLRPAEIRVHQTAEEARRVRCTHCRALTTTTTPVGGRATCAGCGVPLEVFAHYSRRHGAYMGFRADAEELAS
jgi:hypothetical protein